MTVENLHFDQPDHVFRLSLLQRAAAAALSDAIFGPACNADLPPFWHPFALFDADACVATAEATVLTMLCDGHHSQVGAVRRVGVASDRRGRGLFRPLMRATLDWCREQGCGFVLLYTAVPDLYARLGFRQVDQVAFMGKAPPIDGLDQTDIVPLTNDRLRTLLQNRCPVSRQASVIDAPGLVLEQLATTGDWSTGFSSHLGAALVYSLEVDTLVLADVIAPVLPRLDHIVATVAPSASVVRVLFPPDQLAWCGSPELDDTGLMALGPLPPALLRPFRLPPTCEF